MHRHEPPVLAEDVAIVDQNQDYLAVFKPASVPVHPTGRYRYNSLTMLLAHRYPEQCAKIYPSHRLDRLTSGLIVMAKTPAGMFVILFFLPQH